MLRVYYKSNRKETEDKKTITTVDGGYCFSEDDGSERHTYSIQGSYPLKSGLLLQVLSYEPSNFSAITHSCEEWSFIRVKEGTTLLVKEGEACLSFPLPPARQPRNLQEREQQQEQGLEQQQEREQERLLSHLEPWVLEELGDRCTEIEALLQSNMSSVPFQGQSVPLQPEQQHRGHQEASPSQKRQQDQPFAERQVVRPQEALKQPQKQYASKPHQPHQEQPFASGVPKGVKTGSLCQPTNLPVGQPPRKSPYRPKEYQKHTGQTHQKTSYQGQCRINLEDS